MFSLINLARKGLRIDTISISCIITLLGERLKISLVINEH